MSLLQTALLPVVLAIAAIAGDGFLGIYLEDRDGPRVLQVIPGTAAERAGLRAGDRLLEVNGKATKTVDAFRAAMSDFEVGDTVSLTIGRGEDRMKKRVELGPRPEVLPDPNEIEEMARTETLRPRREAAEVAPPVAVEVIEEVTEEEPEASSGAAFLGVQVEESEGALRVTSVVDGGPAARGGVAEGDVLVAVGRAGGLDDLDELVAALGKMRPGQTVRVKVGRDGGQESLSVTLGGDRERAAANAGVTSAPSAEQPDRAAERLRGRLVPAPESAPAPTSRPSRAARAAPPAKPEASESSADMQRLRTELRELREEIRELKELVRRLNRR